MVRQLQPCSTYQVRHAFARSVTSEWSDSAGSIYPVVERLLRLKLIRAQARAGDARGRRDLSVTKQGEAAIQGWVTRLHLEAAASTPDPIRTRMHFIGLLDSRQRSAFLLRAETLTEVAIQETHAFLKLERANSELDYLASVGGLFQLEARLKWLRMVRKKLLAKA